MTRFMKDVQCSDCKTVFSGSRKTSPNNKYYCSQACAKKGSRKVKRPSKLAVIACIKSGETMVSIGKKYGVSDNAIRKWCRAWGVSTRWQVPSEKSPCTQCGKLFLLEHNRKARAMNNFCSKPCASEFQTLNGKLATLTRDDYLERRKAGQSIRSIAREFEVNHTSLIKKFKNHV